MKHLGYKFKPAIYWSGKIYSYFKRKYYLKKITKEYLLELCSQEESVSLDFKLEHHENTTKLIHDILCLSNSDCQSDRYIIYGINDNKDIIGLDSGKNRVQAEIVDCLRSSKINRLPIFLLYSLYVENKQIDVLHIQDTNLKPFLLLEDKRDKRTKFTIRAGVIYTRDNDSNTPINGTSSFSQMEKMWKGYFGIDKTPLDRAYDYLGNITGWEKSNDNEFYFKLFPEFRLIKNSEEIRDDFYEKWVDSKHKSKLGNVKITILYHNTILRYFYAINVEHRGLFPVPKYKGTEDRKGYIIKEQLSSYVCAILENIKPISTYDKYFIDTEKIKSELEVYYSSLKTTLQIYSLDISIIENI